MDTDTRQLTSKTDLFRSLHLDGSNPQDEHLEWLRAEPDLLGEFVRIDGGRNERFATEDQVLRVRVYYWAKKRNKLAKPRKAEIAFWFAAFGLSVPHKLVADHIERSVQSFVSMLYRALGTRGNRSLALEPSEDDTARLGTLMANWCIKNFRLGGNWLTKTLVSTLFDLGFRSMLRRDPFPSVVGTVTRFLEGLGVPDATKHARGFWHDATEIGGFLITGERNTLTRSVQEVRAEDIALVTQAAQDGFLFARMGATVFPWLLSVQTAPPPFGTFAQADFVGVDRFMIPCLAGVMLALRNSETARENIAKMRGGDGTQVISDLQLMRDLLPQLLVRFGAA